MRRVFLFGLAATLWATGFVLAAPAPAQADDRVHLGINLNWTGGYGYPYADHYRYDRHHRPYFAPPPRHHSWDRYRHHHRRDYRRYYSFHDGYHAGPAYRSFGPRPCHPVHTRGYWHGRPAHLGATKCYNRHGHGFVIQGSEYVISFY